MTEINQDVDVAKSGPWDNKLSAFITHKAVVLIIHNLDKDVIEREFRLDYGNKVDRQFIGRVSFWCLNNGRSTEIMSVEDWERYFK